MMPVFIEDSDRWLDRLPVFLKRSSATGYIHRHSDAITTWGDHPIAHWFSTTTNTLSLELPRCHLTNGLDAIAFSEGRHRMQWLIESSVLYLPASIPFDQYYEFFELGLIERRAFWGEPLESLTVSALSHRATFYNNP